MDEGARAIVGPYLATFGASAALVGVVTGAGEAVALVLVLVLVLVFRLFTGPLSNRTRRYWPITIAGYAITVVAVPLLAAAHAFAQAAAAVIAERFGKAARTPARDTMLAHASAELGRGRTFALHEALDQSGALRGLWGIALGVHESTMRAAVTDLVPAHRRGTGYGAFTAAYGLAWLAGSAITGALYDTSPTALIIFVLATQAAALIAFLPLALHRDPRSGAPVN